MNQKPFKQFFAVMLAVSFLWIFAACVMLCGDSVCEDGFSSVSVVSVNHDAHISCPITESTKTTISDRATFDLLSATVYRQAFLFEPKTFYVDFKAQHKEVAHPKPLEILPLIRV